MTTASPTLATPEARTATLVLVALSICHLLNDTIQSLLPALYPLLEANYALSFTQIGMIHLVFQVTASLLQPAVGLVTDRRPMFRLSTIGMGASLAGLVILAKWPLSGLWVFGLVVGADLILHGLWWVASGWSAHHAPRAA